MVVTAGKDKSDTEKVQKARKAFFLGLFDLTWKMLGAMLLPIFIGMFIDSQVGTDKVFALVGFVVGIVAGVFVIRSMIRKMSERIES